MTDTRNAHVAEPLLTLGGGADPDDDLDLCHAIYNALLVEGLVACLIFAVLFARLA